MAQKSFHGKRVLKLDLKEGKETWSGCTRDVISKQCLFITKNILWKDKLTFKITCHIKFQISGFLDKHRLQSSQSLTLHLTAAHCSCHLCTGHVFSSSGQILSLSDQQGHFNPSPYLLIASRYTWELALLFVQNHLGLKTCNTRGKN